MCKYFDIWKTIGDLAGDFEVDYPCAAAWVRRGEIPKAYDSRFVEVAGQRGFIVTRDGLDIWHDAHAALRTSKRGGAINAPTSKLPQVPVTEVVE